MLIFFEKAAFFKFFPFLQKFFFAEQIVDEQQQKWPEQEKHHFQNDSKFHKNLLV
jgi:hypothetical protein